MSKRKRGTPSSLELFLDTICNTFGGIVFLAILLSVIVQNRSRDSGLHTESSPVTAEEAHALALRSEYLNDQFSQLSQIIDDLKPLQPTHEDNRVANIAEQLKEKQESLVQELQHQKILANRVAAQSTKNAELAQSISETQRRTERVKKTVADEKKRLKNQIDERMQILDLPRVEAVSKRTVILMMRFGKIYRLFKEGKSLDKSQLIVSEETATKFIVEPRRDAGWRLSEVSDRLAFTQYLNAFPEDSYAVHVFVWADSFASFSDVKQILLEGDFQYELDPYLDGNSLALAQSNYIPMVQ